MDAFSRFCVVGLGGHALTKLIPAIEANGQMLEAVVSRRGATNFCKTFLSLEEALAVLPSDTAIFLATPPAAHKAQAGLAIDAGFDVLIEKPAFLTASAAKDLQARQEISRTIVAEAFMHRYTGFHARFLDLWARERSQVRSLSVCFLVPGLPAGTFREGQEMGSSTLFDIGCYAVSLLVELGLALDQFTLEVEALGRPLGEKVTIAGEINRIAVDIQVGVAESYANSVAIGWRDGAIATFQPFFFGRSGERSIVVDRGGMVTTERVTEPSAFETMLTIPRQVWRDTQQLRWAEMIAGAGWLERLGAELSARRGTIGA